MLRVTSYVLRVLTFGTPDSQPVTRNPKRATRNSKRVTRNPQPATRNP